MDKSFAAAAKVFKEGFFGEGFNAPSIQQTLIKRLPQRDVQGNVVNITIGNVTGLDSEDVSRSLREELQTKVSL